MRSKSKKLRLRSILFSRRRVRSRRPTSNLSTSGTLRETIPDMSRDFIEDKRGSRRTRNGNKRRLMRREKRELPYQTLTRMR